MKIGKTQAPEMTTRPTGSTRGARPKNQARIQRTCMPQPIRTMTMTANDCNNCRPKGGNTWDGILSTRSKTKSIGSTSVDGTSLGQQVEQISMFLFDPQHVLKFLFSELKTKLKIVLPGDKNVHKILLEIQQTMKRLGGMSSKTPFAASTSNLVQENQEYRVKRFNSSCQTDKNIFSLLLHEKASQTDFGFSGLDRFEMEAQIKQSHERLKENCDALEKACAALQEEKHSIYAELCKCRDEIVLLKTELSYLQSQLKETTSREKCTTQELEEQCKLLQDELKSLHDFLSKQKAELAAVESLSGKLKESSERISLLEKSRLENDKILVFTKLEKEKLMVLQKFRENQMESLQKDIAEVYKLIKEQLAGIQYGIGSGGQINRKNLSNRRNLGRTKIESSSTPEPYLGLPVITTSNSENNLPPESFANSTKTKKLHRDQRRVKSMPSVSAQDGAYDLFAKESITLKDRFSERGDGTEQSSSSPFRPAPGFLTKKHGVELESQQRHVTHKSPKTRPHRKNFRSDNSRPHAIDKKEGDNNDARAKQEQLKRGETFQCLLSEFDEFRKLLDDVIPPSPPRNFTSFPISSSPDASYDLSQVNSSNEQ